MRITGKGQVTIVDETGAKSAADKAHQHRSEVRDGRAAVYAAIRAFAVRQTRVGLAMGANLRHCARQA
jgi:hypothetical protein